MRKTTYLAFISLLYFSHQISLAVTQEDYAKCDIPKSNYGILTKKNTTNCAHAIKWQCFPVEDVEVTLKYIGMNKILEPPGYTGDVTITAYVNELESGDYQIRHEYSMRRIWSFDAAEDMFHKLQKILAKQEYVCIAGGLVSDERDTYKKQDVHAWIFEKMRTKKGCHSWSEGGCNS